MIVLGLTGSIGMGKTTAANMLRRLHVPVHDSDKEVHRLFEEDEKARTALAAEFPYFQYAEIYGHKDKNGVRPFDRQKLGKLVFQKPKERQKLEAVLHPLVRESQNVFIRTQKSLGADIVALDIPLLFETGAEQRVDYTITVSAPAFIQQQRVLSRPNMTAKKFKKILETQMPDSEKCARSDFVVPTGLGMAQTMKALKQIVHDLRLKPTEDHANPCSYEYSEPDAFSDLDKQQDAKTMEENRE